MFEYSRSNNPYQPFINDRHYFKHVGIRGVSASVCRAQYTGVTATAQNRQQRIRNKNETSKIRQERLQKQNRRNKAKNKQQNVTSIVAENTPQFMDLTTDEPETQLRRSTRIRQNRTILSSEEEIHWEDLPYPQQKAQYLVCFVSMLCDVM